jgi:hypothetical protein
METLFELKNNNVVFNPTALMIPEFKKVWERDKSDKKEKAKKDLSYVFYMCDYSSVYIAYPKDIRVIKVNEDFMGISDYKPDEDIGKAMNKYMELQKTPAITSLMSVRNNLEITTDVLNTIQGDIKDNMQSYLGKDKSSVDDREKALEQTLKNLEKVNKIISSFPVIIKMLTDLEDQVKKQLIQKDSIRGGGDMGDYENPDSFKK